MRLPAARPQDTPGWNNGAWGEGRGFNCQHYVLNGWCAGGAFAAGKKWTGAESRPVAAEKYNHPGRNCGACGFMGEQL